MPSNPCYHKNACFPVEILVHDFHWSSTYWVATCSIAARKRRPEATFIGSKRPSSGMPGLHYTLPSRPPAAHEVYEFYLPGIYLSWGISQWCFHGKVGDSVYAPLVSPQREGPSSSGAWKPSFAVPSISPSHTQTFNFFLHHCIARNTVAKELVSLGSSAYQSLETRAIWGLCNLSLLPDNYLQTGYLWHSCCLHQHHK